MSVVNQKEKIQVERRQGRPVVRRQVTEDVGRERQALLARIIRIMWLSITALEVLLGARVVLKLAAANPAVPFALFIYRASAWFLIPFRGLTVTPAADGVVFEVPTIIAMAAYALAGWLLMQLIWLIFKPSGHRRVRTYEEVD